MGDENPRLAVKILVDAFPIEMPGDARVYRAQGIVEQIDIRLPVNRPREIDSRPLTSGQRYTSIADHRHVSLWKLPEILRQGAHICHLKCLPRSQNVRKQRLENVRKFEIKKY